MLIVFDFDGTLADSLSVFLDIYNNDVAPKWKLRPVTPEDWHMLRQSSIAKGLKFIGLRPYQVTKIISESRRLIKARTSDIKLFPGASKLIKQLVAEGHQIYVLSTNDQTLITDVLIATGITEGVQVLKSPRLFGKSGSLRKLLKQTSTNPAEAWMVGDELRDMSAAKKVGMKSLAVTWGFQPEVTLAALKPTAIAHKLTDIPVIIKSL